MRILIPEISPANLENWKNDKPRNESEKENEVYEGLRKPIQLTGKARINPNTGKIEEVHIKEIGIVDQLLVGAKEFFSGRSIEELAQAQGVSPLVKPEKLAGGWPEEDDLDEFLKDVFHISPQRTKGPKGPKIQ